MVLISHHLQVSKPLQTPVSRLPPIMMKAERLPLYEKDQVRRALKFLNEKNNKDRY